MYILNSAHCVSVFLELLLFLFLRQSLIYVALTGLELAM